jgi:hypothetical protein
MHISRAVRILSGFIFAFCLLLVPTMRADEWDQASKLTFKQPIEIPGHIVLGSGTYLFAIMNNLPTADNSIVQIFSADRSKLFATIRTIPIERENPSTTTQIDLIQPQGDEPLTLLSWFYPGRTVGHEFVYSRQQEKNLTKEPLMQVMARPASSPYGD